MRRSFSKNIQGNNSRYSAYFYSKGRGLYTSRPLLMLLKAILVNTAVKLNKGVSHGLSF